MGTKRKEDFGVHFTGTTTVYLEYSGYFHLQVTPNISKTAEMDVFKEAFTAFAGYPF